VKESVDIADVRYALLEVPRTEGGSERFVVGYPNETCLYDVIAAPRIVACGFCSRAAAAGVAETRALTATTRNNVPSVTVLERAQEYLHALYWPERRSDTDQTLRSLRRFFAAIYNNAVSATILMFSSRNMISSAIRTFLLVSF
jgi:hypothetical protein